MDGTAMIAVIKAAPVTKTVVTRGPIRSRVARRTWRIDRMRWPPEEESATVSTGGARAGRPYQAQRSLRRRTLEARVNRPTQPLLVWNLPDPSPSTFNTLGEDERCG